MENEHIIKQIISCVAAMDVVHPSKYKYRATIQCGGVSYHHNWPEVPATRDPMRFNINIQCEMNGEWKPIIIHDYTVTSAEHYEKTIHKVVAELFMLGIWQATGAKKELDKFNQTKSEYYESRKTRSHS